MKINIAKYLLELLLERGDITIPGLGKFEVENAPASYGEGRKTLLPPTKGFSFNAKHNTEDVIFKNHLAKLENLDSAKADEFLSKFTSDIMKGLMEDQAVELAYLGTLKRDGDYGTVSFIQNDATVSKLNKILPEVVLPDPKSVGTPEMVSVPEPTKAKSVNPKPKVESQISDLKPSAKVSAAKPIHAESTGSGWWQWLLAVLLLGAIFVLGFKMCSGEKPDVYKTDETPTASIEEKGTVDSEEIIYTLEEEPTTEDVLESSAQDTGETSGETATISGDDCIIIVASMQNQKNVSRLLNKIRGKNYQSYTEKHGAYTRVGISVDCDEVRGTYKEFIRKISREFDVNAWSLKPEFPQ